MNSPFQTIKILLYNLIEILWLIVILSHGLEATSGIPSYLNPVHVQFYHSGIEKVDVIYIINLEKRPQKWFDTQLQFLKYGIQPNQMCAVNGWLLSHNAQVSLFGSYPMRQNGGQIGCLLSHLSCLNDAYERGFGLIWICEDDILILDNPHILSHYLGQLDEYDNDWDILYTDVDTRGPDGNIIQSLSSDFRPDMEPIPMESLLHRAEVFPGVMRIGQRFGNYSYLVSKRGIKKILDFYFNHYIWSSYDIDIHYIYGIKEYSLSYDLVTVNWTLPSDTKAERD